MQAVLINLTGYRCSVTNIFFFLKKSKPKEMALGRDNNYLLLLVLCLLFCIGDDCYSVEAVPSDDMGKLQAKGNLILKLSHDEIKLAHAGSLSMIANWPLNSLRRYSSENGIFTIEMGRRSPRGQGLYSFKTARDGVLFDKVQFLIKKAATTSQNTLLNRKDDVAAASSGYDIDSRPPAPLPSSSQPPPPLPPKDNTIDDVDSGGTRIISSYHSVAMKHARQVTLTKVSANFL